ncbi:hypothetical protein Forpe1208_v009801 [Fusarium oxysporum f. sp. rapae]|uniref:Uncharacterized protein n=1 Tax=Fusarium oxysporum f. sp. rapae TaxID=485398 RepID=A0A8J5NRR8_FUSOX|nr:hypothetical protein Forpe1208_v009801 [Fusarium oxysporum f. sp. rapae]
MSESQQGKRRPRGQKESDRPKKRQTRAPKAPPSDAALTAARDCLEQRPIYPGRRLDGHLRPDPAVEFATLNPEEEAEAMALFDASQSKVDYEKFRPVEGTNNPTVNEFRSLWKVCLRVFDWSPVFMISPMQGLKYRSVAKGAQQSGSSHAPENPEPPEDPDQPDPTQDPEGSQPSKGTKPSEVIFPPDFSKLLAALIVHPCWEWDVVLFILALQYTVKCRVDNREPWPHNDLLYRVSSLRTLRSMFDDPDREPVGIAEMLEAMHNSQAEGTRSRFSRFLHFLGGQVRSTPSDLRQPQTYLGVDALPVTIKDLRFLTAAVRDFDWGIESWNCSPDDVWKAYRAERGIGRDEVPRTNAETKKYTLRSLKDVYREIAHQKRVSRNGASRLEAPNQVDGLEAPYQSGLDDNQEDVAHEGGAEIPIDDMLNLPAEDTMVTSRGNVPDMPRESTPFYPEPRKREPRRKALVDGEETEDEEEDLQRNQRSEIVSNERQVMRDVRRRDQFGSGMMSGLTFTSPYDQFSSLPSFPRPSARLAPLTPVASGETLSQRLKADDERLERRFEASESSIKWLKEENIRIRDTQKSHGEAIRNLQRGAQLQICPPNEAESFNVATTTQRLGILEMENSNLGQQNQALQERIDQMIKDAAQQQTEWSEKVKTLEQEKSSLLGIVYEKDKTLALQREKVRTLEVQLNAINGIQQEIEPSTDEPVQPSIRLPDMVEKWSEGELDVDARVQASQLGSRRTRNKVAEAFSSSNPGLQRLGQRNY